MPRVELASMQADGTTLNWVEYRDKLMSQDRFEVQETALVAMGDNGKTSLLALANDMRNALLGRIITAWSFPVPVPSQNSVAAADTVIGGVLDLDDYTLLEEAVQPLMDKISGRTDSPKKPEDS